MAPTTCLVCNDEPRAHGVLCAHCREKLQCADGLCPEQIRSELDVSQAAGFLIDRWGRATAVAARSVIGRRADVSIHAAQITRTHAELALHRRKWRIRDLGSRNGTWVNGDKVRGDAEVHVGDVIRLGSVAFYLAADAPALRYASRELSVATGTTAPVVVDGPAALAFGLRLLEPARGGGGLLCRGDARVRVSETQLAFLRWLSERASSAPTADDAYVTSARLLETLPFSSRSPNKTNLTQLVRMTRAKIGTLGLRIEGLRGKGYRLVSDHPDESPPEESRLSR